MINHYIEFMFPAIFINETDIKKVETRDPPKDIPKGCCAYRFYDRSEEIVDGEKLIGTAKNKSGWTFIGTRYTLAEAEQVFPDRRILLVNMRCNKYPAVVRCYSGGQFLPLEPEDTVIDPT